MPAPRLGVVYFRGKYQIVGPATRRPIYTSTSKRRVQQVRELLVHLAPDFLDQLDAEHPEVFAAP